MTSHVGTRPYENDIAIRSLASLAPDDIVDPRLSPTLRATDSDIEEGLAHQFGDFIRHPSHHPHQHEAHGDSRPESEKGGVKYSPEKKGVVEPGDTLYVEFETGDRRNPVNFSYRTKWIMTINACFFTALAAACSSTYNQGFRSMTHDLNCTQFQATIGLATFCLGFGVVPLVTASLSEEFGRLPLYIISSAGFALSSMMIALAPNIQTVIIGRLFNGAFGSTGATLVGGSIADIWMPHERGLPMSIYSLAVMASVGIGAVGAAWIEMNKHLQWRWIHWIHFIITAAYTVSIPFLMKETRAGVLLTRIAKKMRKETGDHRYRARIEDERGSLSTLVWISCTRPLYLLCVEPVVIAFTLWLGFAWGILYCMIESIGPIFRTLHHANDGLVGTAFLAITVGALFGFFSNFYQDRLYTKYVATRGPEARLYCACAAGILFPVGMFIYAWSSFASVRWIALSIGIVLFIWALFLIYTAVFSYLADCYGPFASSALAGQSLFRNMTGMAFPLFTVQMFDAMTYKWANTMFGILAVVMIPIPFVLFFYGPAIRARSKFAGQVMQK